ncbi:MAG: hypothetical protein VXV96_05650 [Bdellovibrionota bacterium]|nr:hypothetical protein [Bdellovibrionota bacterium]
MNYLFALVFTLFSWSAFSASDVGVLKVVKNNNLMSTIDCRELVQKVWEKKYKPYTPKPIYVDYSDEDSEQTTKVILGANSQLLFGVYFVNNLPNEEENFILELETDYYQFAHLPAYTTPKGGASCRIVHTWRSNSASLGIQWMRMNLIEENSDEIALSKKITN